MKVVKKGFAKNLQGIDRYVVTDNSGKRVIEGPFATRSAARNWVRDHKAGLAKMAANRHNNLSAN